VPENAAPASPAAHRLGNAGRHRCGSPIGRTILCNCGNRLRTGETTDRAAHAPSVSRQSGAEFD
jgi:hypothetical protein